TRLEGNGTYKKVRVIPMKDKQKNKVVVEKGPNNALLEEVTFE
ncbi:RNA-binding protein, partial [Leptospira borgpetersenii serovar Balcanica]|nr:RNA-binding protein [Leptospira borgpetersenii serovar Balcanica]